ncbi:MAG: hypothetical protein R3B98_07995 [Hyphomonas sp.]
MSFREKTAWAMGLILTAGSVFYFSKVIGLSRAIGHTAPPIIGFIIAYVILIVIASIVLFSVLGASSPKEANSPADERERQIESRAGHWSGTLLGLGVFAGLWHFWAYADGNMLFHVVFGSLMASQIAEYAFQIFLYRRGV